MAQSIEEILTPATGRILRQAREARGLSVNDVSARLRLNAQYIENMEAGDISPLPPGPYRKAFVTEYAKFLNIKLEDLQGKSVVQEREGLISSAVSAVPGVAKKMTQSAVKTTESAFKKVEEGVKDAVEEITARDLWEEANEVRKERLGIKPTPEEEPRIAIRKKDISPPIDEPAPPVTESRRARRLEFEQRPLEEEYASGIKEEEEETRPGLSGTTKLVVGLLVAIALIIGYSIVSKRQTAPVIAPEEKAEVKPEAKPKPVPTVKKDSVAPAIPAVTSSADSLIFTITAKDSVWVSVSPDVGKGFRGKLAKGEIRRFSAKEKYFLYLGNEKAVAMTLDGKPLTNIPTIPGSNLVVRNAILTRDKISASPAEKTNTPQPKNKQNPSVKKNKKDLPIRRQIPSVKPVLPR